MAQFSAHENTRPESKTTVPYLLDVQSDLLDGLATRVVVPLVPESAVRDAVLKGVMPIFPIDGKPYAMLTPQLAGISKKLLGPAVADLSCHRNEIIGALDILITGI